MDEPLVSVLMSVYNAKADELRQSIESILNQTYSHFEFIIINDASTNDVEEVILSYKDERIKYHKNKKNLHLIATLNKGLGLCTGKYIARLDADDYSAPERLERQVEYMERHPDIGLLGTLFKTIPDNEISYSNVADVPLCIRYIPGCLLHSSAMFRKSLFDEKKIKYDKKCLYAEDFKLWSDISRVSNIAVLPEILTYYRINETGICIQNKKSQNKMLMIISISNIIEDFKCNKTKMRKILQKFIKSIPVTEEEFLLVKKLLDTIIEALLPQISAPYDKRLLQYCYTILRYFSITENPEISWNCR